MSRYVCFKEEDWDYFLSKINFGASNLDAKAIGIWNKPLVLTDDEVMRAKDVD